MQLQPSNVQAPKSAAPRDAMHENVARTMSSREIAELVDARHNDVVATISRLFEKGLLRSSRKSRREATRGRPIEVYDLIERDTHMVVAGYSDEHRAKVIDRWQELEMLQSPAPQIPRSFAEALRLAATLQEQIDKQAPKVAAIHRLAGAQGAICITDAAKQLQIAPAALFAWLQEHRWIYRRQGSRRWIGYQPRIQAGWITHKVTSLKPDPETGAERAAFDPLITLRGLTVLAEKVPGAKL